MTDSTEARQILEAAEQAAAANDIASAERLLREAAAVQERTLGPDHPDLANTLNNLGVVCERLERPDESEQFYRRAYSIATKAFPSDHPFVATSRKNLEDLCRLLGRTVDAPAASPHAAPPAAAPPTAAPPAAAPAPGPGAATSALRLEFDAEMRPTPRAPAAVSVPRRDEPPPSRALSFGAATVVAIALAIVVIGWIAWPSRPAPDAAAPETAATTSRPVAPPPSSAAGAVPAPSPATAPTPPPAPAGTAPPRASASASAAATPEVADARLCRTLSTSGEWRCDPIGDPASPGSVIFYTRIASTRPITVQHRWYQGDRLHQNVMLSVEPNGSGYRTYSRTTVGPDRTGPWRVELRTEDGRVLREERFTVR